MYEDLYLFLLTINIMLRQTTFMYVQQERKKNIRGYYDREEIFLQYRLLTWTLFIDQFVHPVEGEGMG